MAPPSYKDRVLAHLPGTCKEVAAAAGVHPETVSQWMTRLRGTEVYISGWVKVAGRNNTPVWSRGTMPDKKCPFKLVTKAQSAKRYRDKLVKNGEYYFIRAKRRAQWHADQKAKGKPQGPFAALGL